MKLTLRDKIAVEVSHAIQGTIEHPSKEVNDYYQNRANWVNIATDSIISAVTEFLPDAVDISSKYELSAEHGVFVNIGTDQDEERNGAQLEYLARFADDKGYNRYRAEVLDKIEKLYKVRTKHHTIKKD